MSPLASISSKLSLSGRGDTFLVRGYGESLDESGRVAAGACCEASVQRMPEYVDPTDEADTPLRNDSPGSVATDALRPANRSFGRRFEIVFFRWLNEGEV